MLTARLTRAIATGGGGPLGRLQQGGPDAEVAEVRDHEDVLQVGQRVHPVGHPQGGRALAVQECLTHREPRLPGHQVETFVPPLSLQAVGDDDPMPEGGGDRLGLVDAQRVDVHELTLTQGPPSVRAPAVTERCRGRTGSVAPAWPEPGTGSRSSAYVGQMDDEALLDRCRRGDRDAFTPLVHRYQDELYTMALRLTGNPADAADVVQETFTRAFRSLPRLRGATVRAWLFRVAVNCAHDVHRQRVRRPADPLEDPEGRVLDLPDPGLGPEATALQRERAVAVRQALLTLPHDFRVAVVLRDVNQLSYEEMAEALSVPLGTVKSRISRARVLLATSLRAYPAVFPEAEVAP